MLKKIENNMSDYLKINSDPGYLSSDWKEKIYFFGYVDAYFDESVYKPYIVNTLNNENKLVSYDEGFAKGTTDRKHKRDNDPKGLIKEKENWLKGLALNDVLNDINDRNLKEEALDIYNFYKTVTFSLRTREFDEKYKSIHKR